MSLAAERLANEDVGCESLADVCPSSSGTHTVRLDHEASLARFDYILCIN